jgi:deaminated glutathione amidase
MSSANEHATTASGTNGPRAIRAAVVQMCSTPDVDANLARAEVLAREARSQGAELILLPEAFAFLGPEDEKQRIVEPLPEGGPILARCQALARELGAALVLGGFHERGPTPERAFNTAIHLAADGRIVDLYRKIHLFDVDLADGTRLRESARTAPGNEVVVSPTPFGPLGLSVCYDVRFPELYRQQAARGAVMLAVPSAFTLHTGRDHWHVLLRARAIECQAYVLAPAQWGRHHGSRVSYGHSLICDPWGCVIAECSDGEGVAVATLDPALVRRVRSELPSLEHRRL